MKNGWRSNKNLVKKYGNDKFIEFQLTKEGKKTVINIRIMKRQTKSWQIKPPILPNRQNNMLR